MSKFIKFNSEVNETVLLNLDHVVAVIYKENWNSDGSKMTINTSLDQTFSLVGEVADRLIKVFSPE